MKKILLIVICLLLACIGTATAQPPSVTVSLETPSLVVDPCENFDVDLVVSGLGHFVPLSVGDFDIDILYDPSLMEFVAYDLGSYLGDLDAVPLEALDFSWGDLGTGAIDLAEVSLLSSPELDSLQPSEFTLAVVTFHCLGPGTSPISIDPSDPLFTYKVGDELGGHFTVNLGDPLTITQTPEPCTILLIGTGLAGLGVFRKKFRK